MPLKAGMAVPLRASVSWEAREAMWAARALAAALFPEVLATAQPRPWIMLPLFSPWGSGATSTSSSLPAKASAMGAHCQSPAQSMADLPEVNMDSGLVSATTAGGATEPSAIQSAQHCRPLTLAGSSKPLLPSLMT